MRRALGVVGALVALLAFAPAAPARAATTTQTSSSGIVSATFSFTSKLDKFGLTSYSHEMLTISRSGTMVYSQPVTDPFCGNQCWPGAGLSKLPSVHVLDLEHNGQPDVDLSLYSGGAHCCSIEQIFRWDPGTMTYVETSRNFRDPGDQVKDLGHNGHLEFLSADDAFAYAFTAYAGSGLPIQILTFSGRKFHDVTRSYPKLIRKDAAVWLKLFKANYKAHAGDGAIAAWAADEDLLGRSAQVKSYLNQQQALGHLKNLGVPSGQQFINALQKFLRKHGYVK